MDPLNYGFRKRGVLLPTESTIREYKDEELRLRAEILAKLGSTLHLYWYEFASERITSIPQHHDLERMYLEFLNCYRLFLWQFKKHRKSEDQIERKWHRIRVTLWDKNLFLWKQISIYYAEIESVNFYDELCGLAHHIGMVNREMELHAKGALNFWEYYEHQKISTRKGAEIRHSENRAMKQDVYAWLDSNMKNYKSMDAAATAVAGKVAPIAWRTARDWVGEWRRVRSAGTP